MRKWVLILAAVFILGMWNWMQGAGTWIVGPTSTDYSSGTTPTGSVVYNDINEFKAAFNGGIGDTNIMESAEIDLDKLEEGVLYHAEGNAAPKKIAYGDLNMHWANVQAAYNCVDTLLPDSSYLYGIVFADSSDVGDPGFSATPHIMLTLGALNSSTVGVGDGDPAYNYIGWRKALTESLHFSLYYAAAETCSVYVHWTGADTIFNGVQLNWEAKQK